MLLVNGPQTQWKHNSIIGERIMLSQGNCYLIMETKLSSLVENLKYFKINFELSVINSLISKLYSSNDLDLSSCKLIYTYN